MSAAPTPIHTGRKLGIAKGENRRTSRVKNGRVTWAEFVARIKKPVVTDETVEEYAKLTKAEQDNIKDVGYFVGGPIEHGIRKKENVLSRDLIVLDGDHADQDFQSCLNDTIGGYEWAIYTTHKHTPEKPRFRLIFPLKRPIQPAEYAPIARKLAEKINIEYFDSTTDEFERAMFWPSHSCNSEFIAKQNEGLWVDPDEILSEYDDWADIASWPKSSRHPEKRPYAGEKAEDPRNKKGIIGAFCRVYDIHSAILEFIPELYAPTSHGRYTYTGSTTSNGAVTYENLWLYSHHESDPCSTQLCNAFDLIRIHKFGKKDAGAKPQTNAGKLPSFKAMVAFLEVDEDTQAELVREIADGFEDTDDTRWLGRLDTEDGQIRATLKNFNLILTHDKNLHGIAFNELRQGVARTQETPWAAVQDQTNGDPWTDTDDLKLRLYIENRYRVEMTAARALDAVSLAASKRIYNPIHDYLNALKWDRTPRLDGMLHRHMGVARNAYTEAVSRKFMCAAVARIFQPGIKFDHCLILEGGQGRGKSTFLKTLAVKAEWFGDDVPHLHGKEVIESNQGRWIIELSELQAFGKSEIEKIKAFMSRTSDRARLAYKRRAEDFPRQMVFAGTTNDNEYLKDDTGNRRFWPVKCNVERLNIPALEAEVDQLWAEAIIKWRAGEPLYLEDEEVETLAKQEQSARHIDDGLAGVITEWLDRPIERFETDGPPTLLDKVCARQIWVECMGGAEKDYNSAKAGQIGRAMRKIEGWTVAKNVLYFGRYGRQRGWLRDV